MALMAFSDSEVYNDKSCSKTCLKNYETLNKQCDDLIVKLNDTEFKAATYKRGLATVEDQLVTFRKNEVLFGEEIAILKREVGCKDYEISVLKTEFEKVKQEKEGIDFKIAKFDNASKDLDKLLVSLDEFKEPDFNGYGPRETVLKSTIDCDKESDNSKENTDDSLEKEQVSDNESSFVKSPLKVDKETIIDWKETVFHTAKKVEFVKPKNSEKLVKKIVRYAEMYRSQSPRGNQRNWNGQKSNQLGSEFVMYNKACFICESFDHMKINCPHHQRKMMVTGNNYNKVDYDYYAKTSHPNTHRNMTPRAVLLKSSLKPLSTARPVYTAHPKPIVHSARLMPYFSKQAQSTVQRPFYKKPALTNRYFNHKVNTIRPKVVNTARPYTSPINTVKANGVNAVKPLECWVWRPTRPNGASLVFNRYNYIDARGRSNGCSRHLTGKIAYLSNFKELDRGHVTFGGGAYGGRISGKGTLKTDSLDFDDVYFVKELNFNLFSISQMCDKRNYVLFTDTECLVLSLNFKLPDESQILLKIPRKDNMYSFDMKNIVPKESLTCLVAKATLDKSMLWHRRLGHINFKNINKLVKENLVRGLPLKRFENDQTCVACLKGKQHRASCKSKVMNPITKPLFMLHMDLFGLTFVSSFMHKKYCLVITNDYSRFTWVFFLATKDETSEILKNFIKEIENLVDKKVKIIRCDNGTEFKNKVMDDFCKEKVLMILQKNTTYFDSPSKDVSHDEPKSSFDDQEQAKDGPNDENTDQDKSVNNSSPKEDNTTKPQVIGLSRHPARSYERNRSELGKFLVPSIVPTTPNTRIHKDHPIKNVISDVKSSVQTRRMLNPTSEQGFIGVVYEGKTHKDLHIYLFACFLSLEEPNRVIKALSDPAWVEAMQEELLQFKLQKVWILVDLPKSKRPIVTKWIFRNKKDEKGIVIRNKSRLVAQGYTQEEGIDYDDVFAPVARIKAIRLFLAYASFMGFMVYQMDVKSAFFYGQIEEEVYVRQPLGFEDPDYLDKVYKVVKALYGLHQELCTGFEKLMKEKFQMSSMGELTFFLGLQVQQKKDGIFISQDKYVDKILKKFNYTDVKSASTPVDLEKPLVKDGDATDVDVHLYRSMIGSLMYLTASRLDIMFAVCACARFQVTPKTSHLLAVKRIFRYLKGKPTLGLWYSRDSPFELVAYTDSDYAGATQDRKSTTGGCQFLGNRLISWQCKKQTVVATSTTEAEYVAAASYYRQVLWIQNQLLDYGYNFINTMIYIDNNSTVCIIENPVQHAKTKHIEIRHYFIRDCNTKKLIQMVKIDTEHNVADLLTKGFDAGRFQYLVSSIGMLNP
ncbi:putative ribonuclease H-like domain-containing protein [Tanacetum coccineum]